MIPVAQVFKEISGKREELSEQLVSYALTDSLLFMAPKENVKPMYERDVYAAVNEVNNLLDTCFEVACGLDIPAQNYECRNALATYLRKLSDSAFAVVYLAAMELRSVLGGILFCEKKVDAKKAFELAFYEELSQQENWGTDEVICRRQANIKSKLKELERFRDEGSLS